MAEDAKKLTFFQKNPIECPVCGAKFYREELLTGGGRMIAGDLTKDLRRLYEPSKKVGEVFPLIYSVTVCPSCLYAAVASDFSEMPEKIKHKLAEQTERRNKSILPVFDDLDFTQPRNLKEGVASYYFAVMCYDHFPKEFTPTIKQGYCCLRAAWICNDLHRKSSNENFDFLALNFYRKARFFYNLAIEKEQTGKESMSMAKNLGPDLDKNYGYVGGLYLAGLFEYLYGPREDAAKRIEALTKSKRAVARIFGMGRASKNKPAALLDKARDLYTEMTKELETQGIKATTPEEDAKNG